MSEWCAIEGQYTDHDTAHHEAIGGLAIADRVRIKTGEYAGKEGLVQQIRNPREIVVRVPGRRGNTVTATCTVDDVERIG